MTHMLIPIDGPLTTGHVKLIQKKNMFRQFFLSNRILYRNVSSIQTTKMKFSAYYLFIYLSWHWFNKYTCEDKYRYTSRSLLWRIGFVYEIYIFFDYSQHVLQFFFVAPFRERLTKVSQYFSSPLWNLIINYLCWFVIRNRSRLFQILKYKYPIRFDF